MANNIKKYGGYKPKGMYAAIITPSNDNVTVNENELRKLIGWLVEKGVHGVVPLGSIGEFIHLDAKEKKKTIKISVEEAKGKIDVLPGATETCSANSIEQAKYAREVGANGVLVGAPYYLKITQEMLEAHFEIIAKSLPDFPIVLYTIPMFSTPISYDVVKRLSRAKNIVGIKDSGGSMVDQMNYIDITREVGGDIHFMAGRDEMIFPSMASGADGAITGACGVIPEIILDIYNSFMRGDYERALQLQNLILSLVRAMMALPFPLGFKAVLEYRGFNPGPSLQVMPTAEEKNHLKMKNHIYKLLENIFENSLLKEYTLHCNICD